MKYKTKDVNRFPCNSISDSYNYVILEVLRLFFNSQERANRLLSSFNGCHLATTNSFGYGAPVFRQWLHDTVPLKMVATIFDGLPCPNPLYSSPNSMAVPNTPMASIPVRITTLRRTTTTPGIPLTLQT